MAEILPRSNGTSEEMYDRVESVLILVLEKYFSFWGIILLCPDKNREPNQMNWKLQINVSL